MRFDSMRERDEMENEIKENLKKIAGQTELKVTRSLLKWKFNKEGRPPPGEEDLERQSKLVRDKARKTISKSGRRIWDELKNAYHKKGSREVDKD